MVECEHITVDKFIEFFPDIEYINYAGKILVFDEEFSEEELDKIYDVLRNKWNVNKLWRLNTVHDCYEDSHELVEKQIIFVENCDLEVVTDAYDLVEYLEDEYDVYRVVSQASLDAGRY